MNNILLPVNQFISEIEKKMKESELILKGKCSEEYKLKIDLIIYDLYLEFNITPKEFDFEKTKKLLGL